MGLAMFVVICLLQCSTSMYHRLYPEVLPSHSGSLAQIYKGKEIDTSGILGNPLQAGSALANRYLDMRSLDKYANQFPQYEDIMEKFQAVEPEKRLADALKLTSDYIDSAKRRFSTSDANTKGIEAQLKRPAEKRNSEHGGVLAPKQADTSILTDRSTKFTAVNVGLDAAAGAALGPAGMLPFLDRLVGTQDWITSKNPQNMLPFMLYLAQGI